jgi:hypothetical protein
MVESSRSKDRRMSVKGGPTDGDHARSGIPILAGRAPGVNGQVIRLNFERFRPRMPFRTIATAGGSAGVDFVPLGLSDKGREMPIR